MNPKKAQPKDQFAPDRARRRAFTLVELMMMCALVGLGAMLLVPALAQSRMDSMMLTCMNNQRQLVRAWQLYATDFNEILVAANANTVDGLGRPAWMTGSLDFTGSNPSNYNTNQDIVNSPLWPYTSRKAGVFSCPSEHSARVRSVSMNGALGRGAWLNGSTGSPDPYRIYVRLSEIRSLNHTFVFLEEHPDSINDGAFATSCAGAQPTDSPSQARIIDYPAAYHRGGCTFSFADGHVEVHGWLGATIRSAPVSYNNFSLLPLNVSAGNSWGDIHWLAANTTVKK
ncbi:MAG TPA: hypothetical protein VL527_11050 [Dongiaceae bacterium]|jgi:prepilin-type processing-associated H-X9-DG protein|nr:hypothetical protein [Dongiaceae bacterium]